MLGGFKFFNSGRARIFEDRNTAGSENLLLCLAWCRMADFSNHNKSLQSTTEICIRNVHPSYIQYVGKGKLRIQTKI